MMKANGGGLGNNRFSLDEAASYSFTNGGNASTCNRVSTRVIPIKHNKLGKQYAIASTPQSSLLGEPTMVNHIAADSEGLLRHQQSIKTRGDTISPRP